MLTGTVPFTGANPLAVMNARLVSDPPAPSEANPEISPQLEEIVFRALEKEPRHRYATASEMALDLENQHQVGISDRARPERKPVKKPLRKRINKKVLLYCCLALVPVVLFGLMLALARK
jgi:hypothetical protein